MGLLVHVAWGDSWRRPKEGLGRVVDVIQASSDQVPKPQGPDEPSVDVYIYVSGGVWQHNEEGIRLGSLSNRSRNWLRAMIYVPDDLREEEESMEYFDRTFKDLASAVEARLRKRRPDWPIETLVQQIRSLSPSR